MGAPAAGGGGATKIIPIVVGVVVLFGAIGVAGLVYVGYRAKQEIAELAQDYGVSSGPDTLKPTPAGDFPPSTGSGCSYLPGQEAARVLGVAVDRVEFNPNGQDGSEECTYWVTAAERRKLIGSEIASGVGKLGKDNEKDQKTGFENIVGGALNALTESQGDNKGRDFAFQISGHPHPRASHVG